LVKIHQPGLLCNAAQSGATDAAYVRPPVLNRMRMALFVDGKARAGHWVGEIEK